MAQPAYHVSLSITSIKLALESEKPGRNVYLDFRRGGAAAQTEVRAGAGGGGAPITWDAQLDLPPPDGGGASDQLQVRAYDKQAMMPDGLLGSASVDVHQLGRVASPTVPGSGGGRPVQAQLIGRWGQFGGHVSFYLTASGGGAVMAGGAPQASQGSGEAAPTAGFTGAGATAFPAESAGKQLPGEHLSDFQNTGQTGGEEGTLPPTAGFSGGGATAFPAESAGKTLPGEHLSDFTDKGSGPRGSPSSPTAGFSGGGATAFPAQAAGKDLHGEHLSDFNNQGDDAGREAPSSPTAGFSGGGATAFPAQAAGKDLRGEHLSDFETRGASASTPGAVAATAGYGGGGATAFPAEAAGTVLPGEHLSDFEGKGGSAAGGAQAGQASGSAQCAQPPAAAA